MITVIRICQVTDGAILVCQALKGKNNDSNDGSNTTRVKCHAKGIKIAKYRFVIFSLCLYCCPFITAPTMPIKKIAIDICLLPVSPRPWCVGVGLHYTNPIIATASHHRIYPLCLLQILLGETEEKRGNRFD